MRDSITLGYPNSEFVLSKLNFAKSFTIKDTIRSVANG